MKLKKLLFLFAFISGVLFLVSCEKDKVENTVTFSLQVTSEKEIPDYSEFTVELKELRTLKVTKAKLTEKGICEMAIDKGTYTITVEWKKGNVSIFGTKESYSVTKPETITIPLTFTTSQPEGLVFKEIFFNGETNNGEMMHPDQYLVLYNNGDETVYADGVTFAVTLHANWNEADVFSQLLPGEIVAAQFYSIPGDGMQYPIEPAKEIVIAATAINHSDNYENSVDLSGADFEIYDTDLPENFSADVDNPEVPNLIGHFSAFGFFAMHPRGPLAPFIFKPETDMKTFMEANKFEYKNKKGESRFAYKVPANLVIDGIETGNEGYVIVKSLPPSVDKGFITVTGCHRQELIRRKVGANDKLMDTNDSSVDCERVKGQNAYSKKGPKTTSTRNAVHVTSDYNKFFPVGIEEFKNSGWDVLN